MLEFFNSLLLHNVLFKKAVYTLLGFAEKANVLFAVLKQPFICSDGTAKLGNVSDIMMLMVLETKKETAA